MPWFVKTEAFKASLSFPEIRPHLDAHKEWVAGLRAEGVTITSGYRVDENGRPGGGGLMIFAAESFAEAERLVSCDPLIANGCVDWQLNEWIADVGDISLVDGGAWYAKTAPKTRAPPPVLSAMSDSPPPRPCVTLDPDYRLAATLAGLVTLGVPFGLGVLPGVPLGGLAAFLASRTAAVRFVFDSEALEIMQAGADGTVKSGRENFAVGGRNRWAYEAITAWAMYPSPEAAVLVYFRERQTRPEGQGHLFPVLCAPADLRRELDERVGGERRVTGPPSL
jgi:uncharacterized protein YciI